MSQPEIIRILRSRREEKVVQTNIHDKGLPKVQNLKDVESVSTENSSKIYICYLSVFIYKKG